MATAILISELSIQKSDNSIPTSEYSVPTSEIALLPVLFAALPGATSEAERLIIKRNAFPAKHIDVDCIDMLCLTVWARHLNLRCRDSEFPKAVAEIRFCDSSKRRLRRIAVGAWP